MPCKAMLPRIRAHVSVPVGVGFGIRDAATARAIGEAADAVVVGSKIIQLIDDQPRDQVASTARPFCATSAARSIHNAPLKSRRDSASLEKNR
jgi:tryptophan synthase alpha subunit